MAPHHEDLTPERKREWNRAPLQDLFPRIPGPALELILDKCSAKPFHYNLSESKLWNARRFDSIVVAHVRHFYSEYDKLLRHEDVERYEARRRTADKVWKVLREWCPWDADNEVLRGCFEATLLPAEQRDPTWDPMDLDDDDDFGGAEPFAGHGFNEIPVDSGPGHDPPDDPMDLD